MGYSPHAWVSFGGAIAAMAGALTGLLFVALSVKGKTLFESPAVSSRAAQTLVLFMTSVLIAIVLVAPQSRTAIGIELLVVAVVVGGTLYLLARRAGHATTPGVIRSVEQFSPNTLTAVPIAIAGGTLLGGAGGGLFWLIPSVVASLVGGVVNAWLFLVQLPG